MNYDDVVKSRRSIRGYLDKPVPKELIREILEIAMRAPTSMNSQPWNFYVVAGEVLDRIRKGNVERNVAGVPDSREFRMGPPYAGVHRARLRDQFPRHHAEPRRARRGRHPGRPSHPDLRRHGLARRHLPGKCRRLNPEVRRRSSSVPGVLGKS